MNKTQAKVMSADNYPNYDELISLFFLMLNLNLFESLDYWFTSVHESILEYDCVPWAVFFSVYDVSDEVANLQRRNLDLESKLQQSLQSSQQYQVSFMTYIVENEIIYW